MHILTFIFISCVFAMASSACFAANAKTPPPSPTPASLESSANASKVWLELLDKGHYPESWDQSSAIMKLTIPKQEWVDVLNLTRKPLGNANSRQVLDQRTAQNPHGLPAGQYMVMYYKTNFSHKPNGKELVTLFLEDGQWKVLTYQVD